eukprot:CAMPEP_0113551238 /NCGR_PEP_ID=MMETSP0015_2-20120614/14420_1 /TAXON_ID=2838 /ORGANISM="Odontella" /LENGTH=774 /DNA_ID=CAMNT_0000452121 /DNA_START=11 /DNA_END=2331 /DNA_ORIENTATION=+ /assembly_acc=CAM_ASM_000160
MAPTDDGSRHRLQRGRELKTRQIDSAEKRRIKEEEERSMQELARSVEEDITPTRRRRSAASSSSDAELDRDDDVGVPDHGRLIAKLEKDGSRSADSFWGGGKGGSKRVTVRVKLGGEGDDDGGEAGSKLSPAEMAGLLKKKKKKRKIKDEDSGDTGKIDSNDDDEEETPWRKPKKKSIEPPAPVSIKSEADAIRVSDVVAEDGNFYRCDICHDRGNVLCCDGCPKVFHKKCLSPGTASRIVEDPWYCNKCFKKNAKKGKVKVEAGSEVEGDKAKSKMAKWLTKGPTPKKFDDIRKKQTEKVQRIKKEEEEKRVAKEKAGIPKKARSAVPVVSLPKKVKVEEGAVGPAASVGVGRKDGSGNRSLISSMPPPPATKELGKQGGGGSRSLISSMAPPTAASLEASRQTRPPFGSDRRFPQARPWQQQQQQQQLQTPPSAVKSEQQQTTPHLPLIPPEGLTTSTPTPTLAVDSIPTSSAPQAAGDGPDGLTRKTEHDLGTAVDAVMDLCTQSKAKVIRTESPADPAAAYFDRSDRSSSKGRSTPSAHHIVLNGSFANGREEKYDFFDHDSEGKVVHQSRIPIFPEDFEPGQKEWPLRWWGIVEPSKELLEEHEKGYPALTEILERRKEQEKYEDEMIEYKKKMRDYEEAMKEYERQYGPQQQGPPPEQLGPFGGSYQGRGSGGGAGPPFPPSQGQVAHQGYSSGPGDRTGKPPPQQGYSERDGPGHQQQQQPSYGQRDAQGRAGPSRREYGQQQRPPPRFPPSNSPSRGSPAHSQQSG